ncbi:hypothetical protein ACKWTF_007229 [Chironomus riparius]
MSTEEAQQGAEEVVAAAIEQAEISKEVEDIVAEVISAATGKAVAHETTESTDPTSDGDDYEPKFMENPQDYLTSKSTMPTMRDDLPYDPTVEVSIFVTNDTESSIDFLNESLN